MSAELYLDVFTDGVLSSFLIPLRSQTAFFAMRAFGEQSADTMHMAALAGVAGGTVGHTLNWLLGFALLYVSKKKKIGFWDESYEKIRPYYTRYGLYTLLLSWATLFGVFSVAAGIFAVPLKRALPLIFIGQALYYWHYL